MTLSQPLLGATEKRHSNPFTDQRPLSSSVDEKDASEKDHVNTTLLPAGVAVAGGDGYRALDPEKSFFPYLDDRLGAPGTDSAGYTFPMMWDEKEDDDDMHMPMVDDDIKLKPRWKDRFARENLCSVIGIILMFVGMLCLFVILPVLSSTGLEMIDYAYETPLDEFPNTGKGPAWAHVNDRKYPLLKNMRSGLLDPDTPKSAYTKTSLVDGETLNLVFSDEFNDNNRTFYRGDDPFFFGFDGWYGATQDLEWYDPDAISTIDGVLTLQLDSFENHNLKFRSGMLNSWNQLCFKGGIWEVSVSLPGPAGIHGLWPGVWSMGNLGRPGYLATTDGMWPYTYDSCDAGITPNQSMTDGTSKLPGQRLPSCTCPNSDHPTPGTGRGAPEIDIIEVAADYGGKGWATATQSFQVAPFDMWYYPNYEYFYTPDYNLSFVNTYTGGPYQQAVSTTTVLNNDWFDGQAYQRYSYDYKPGSDKNAYLAWAVGDEIMAGLDARSLGPNGNIGQRVISEEPMSMILNLGISNSWTNINWEALKFPTVMRVDYIRLYQREGDESVTCDPPGYETTEYIAKHPEAYNNPNVTKWTDIPGYTVPKNSFMHGC
ncbi:glycoside hydrolase family 16 protein [Myriangium duriaei CBS 260.36]|uniref:Glycoside hydrolase family 16 protein n=1 Tax=Myriangium duriaei CBS 260.36 TaxID=1168546 RepID=A0A9P4J3N2_9PEZI|nr:glycoside hydrolase family 16 protein [Myriangium duriaei CBS 260.36]